MAVRITLMCNHHLCQHHLYLIITCTVPAGPARPGSLMISAISSMMLFSPEVFELLHNSLFACFKQTLGLLQ